MSTARHLKPHHRGYIQPAKTKVNHDVYDKLSISASANIVRKLTVPKQGGLAWELKEGQTCRVVTAYGSQVGDVNFWNLRNFQERFYSGKTRQLHQTHLSTYDRLWSCLPYLNPMATVTQDSIKYGFDEDGLSIHDVIGTRCDPYTYRLINGTLAERSCHQNLTEAVKPWGLREEDVHDVFNIFMCSGFHRDTHEYVIRGSPARVGDYIEWVAEMDLLVALSACPHGDVSLKCGDTVPDDICFPLDVYIGQAEESVLVEWKTMKGCV